jgi:neopullulanase
MPRAHPLWLCVFSLMAWCGLGLSASARAAIDRFEPASWWIGFKDPTLQILVHGPKIGGLTPKLDYPGVKLIGTKPGANPNYLFIDLEISPSAAPGSVEIAFQRKGRTLERRVLQLQARAAGSAQRLGFAPKDAIYLITPDRFANGNPGNDSVKGLREAANRAIPGGRHGGDIEGVIGGLDYIAGMGFTQVWLNPLLENDQPEYSYHGYATTDFYRVDPRYGSNEDMRRLSAAAKARGVGLIMDMILNHVGSKHWWMADPPGPDWINFGGKFSQTNHLHITQMDPYVAQRDAKQFADGWFVEVMPDLNQRDAHLAKYLIQNSIWWIEYANLSGVRMDTYPYPDKAFMSEWSRRVNEEYPNFTVVGEEWVRNPAQIAYWQKGHVNKDGYVSYLPSLMDFPLQDMMRQALTEEEKPWPSSGLFKLYEALANDFVYTDPGRLVVFPDNHDMDRILTQMGGDIALAKMALGYVATVRGIPQIYYGTEVLATNPGPRDDGIIRSDFPGGFAGDKVNAFTGAGLSPDQRDFQDFIRKLLIWRRSQPALMEGRLIHFALNAGDAQRKGVYVLARLSADDGVLIAINKDATAKSLPSGDYAEALRGKTSGRDVISGRLMNLARTLDLPARSITIIDLD